LNKEEEGKLEGCGEKEEQGLNMSDGGRYIGRNRLETLYYVVESMSPTHHITIALLLLHTTCVSLPSIN